MAEPIMHYQDPPHADGGTAEAARQAMVYTFFHWGLHAWAVYVVLGLSVAYFSFRHSLPLTIRSIFYPLLGDRNGLWSAIAVTRRHGHGLSFPASVSSRVT